jgi:DNA-directed RNA polymerase
LLEKEQIPHTSLKHYPFSSNDPCFVAPKIMHTRLNKLVPRNRARLVRGRWLDELMPTNTAHVVGVRRSLPCILEHHQRMYSTSQNNNAASRSSLDRSLHTTSKSLAPPVLSSLEKDDYDETLEQEIDMFASSCLTKLLPDDIFYADDEGSNPKGFRSLDLELGNDSVSEALDDDETVDLDGGAEQDDWIVEEEQLSSRNIETQNITSADIASSKPRRKKTAIEILRNFDPQDAPDSDDPEDLQLWLECSAQREAVLKYQKLVEKARDRKAFDSMGLMQRYIVQWYQALRDAIEIRQKEYLTNQDTRRGKKRYGPFMCSLHPEKMAVILSQEAITQALLSPGKNGREGVPLVKMAMAIGSAVETEVISQRRMKERFVDMKVEENNDDNDDAETESEQGQHDSSSVSGKKKEWAIDSWKFSASHLKMFMEDLNRMDPSIGKSKRAVAYAMRRARQAMNSEANWRAEDLTHIGAALLSIFIEHAKVTMDGKDEPVFRVEKRWSENKKTTSYIVLNDNLYALFLEEDFLSLAASTTRHTPMIVPPSDWAGPKEGGYRWLQVDLMRTRGSNFQKEALEHGDLSLLYEGLNILGRTAWKINTDILQVAHHCWENDIAIGDIARRTDFEVPSEPVRPERIAPEIYANKESTEAQTAVAANKAYRDKMHKRFRMLQKNMVRGFCLNSFN